MLLRFILPLGKLYSISKPIRKILNPKKDFSISSRFLSHFI